MLNLRSIKDPDVAGKRVLVRVDFNVTLDTRGDVKEYYKIAVCKETVDFLLGQPGTKVALLTHFGRPEGKPNPGFSVRPMVDDVERIVGRRVRFVEDCVGEKVEAALENLSAGEILLLENVRFHPEEKTNETAFAKRLAENFDVYVNEAFGVSHRDQASVTGVTKFLPSSAGLHVLKEVNSLAKLLQAPLHPAVAIIGGAKIETKLPVIEAFEAKYDHVLLGSKIADEARAAGMRFSERVKFPTDFLDGHLDIGPEAIAEFVRVIGEAKTIVWNGPLGKFEISPYDRGTQAILEAIVANQGAFSVAGGGETVQVLEEAGAMDKLSFVSTGGGAMLDFLAGTRMPGLEVLKSP